MIKSQLNIPRLVMLFIAMGACCVGFILILTRAFNAGDYSFLVVATLPIGFFAVCYYFLSESNIITIENDDVVIKSVFGRTKRSFKISELHNWLENHVVGKYNTYDKLCLIGADFEYKTRSLCYTNYTELKFALTRFKIKH